MLFNLALAIFWCMAEIGPRIGCSSVLKSPSPHPRRPCGILRGGTEAGPGLLPAPCWTVTDPRGRCFWTMRSARSWSVSSPSGGLRRAGRRPASAGVGATFRRPSRSACLHLRDRPRERAGRRGASLLASAKDGPGHAGQSPRYLHEPQPGGLLRGSAISGPLVGVSVALGLAFAAAACALAAALAFFTVGVQPRYRPWWPISDT